MSVNKKVLSIAILGALASGNAIAAADLSAPDGAVPAYFAEEIIIGANGTEIGTSAAGATLNWDIGYNFSAGEVRYVRVQCSDNIEFDAATSVTSTDAGAAANIGSVNGLGTNVLTFSVTSVAPNVAEDDTFVVSGDHTITSTDDVNCSVGLYDQPSQAQTGGTVGLISNTFFSGAYLAFVQSYELISTPQTAIADVEAVPAFSEFDNGTTTDTLATWTLRLRDPDGNAVGSQTATFNVLGSQFTNLNQLLDATSTITVMGDFSAVDAAADVTLGGTAAATRTDTMVTFGGIEAGATNAPLVITTNGDPIPASEYEATLNAVSEAPLVYEVADLGPAASGEIVRNGTEIQAPLAQVPAGYISRMVLTNTGTLARSYAVEVLLEAGNTRFGGDASMLTGTIPANSMVVVDLNPLMGSFSGAPRGALNATVAGPNKQIQGLYQIVNPANGSISNHVMVRPGTN